MQHSQASSIVSHILVVHVCIWLGCLTGCWNSGMNYFNQPKSNSTQDVTAMPNTLGFILFSRICWSIYWGVPWRVPLSLYQPFNCRHYVYTFQYFVVNIIIITNATCLAVHLHMCLCVTGKAASLSKSSRLAPLTCQVSEVDWRWGRGGQALAAWISFAIIIITFIIPSLETFFIYSA